MASDSPRTVNGFLIFLGSIAAFVGVIVIVVSLLAVNRNPGNEIEKKRAEQRIATREKLDAEVEAKMHSSGWVDKAKGVAFVPVADAVPLAVAELRAKKPAPSQVKVDPVLPMPPPYDPNATEPAPPALTSSPQGADTVRFTAPAAPEAAAPAAPAAPAPAPTAPAPAAAPQPAAAAPAAPAPANPAPAAPPAPAPAPEAAPATPPAPAPAPAPAAPANPAPATPPAPASPSPSTPTENSAPAQ